MERELSLTINLDNDGFSVILYDHQSGYSTEIPGIIYDPGEHHEFDAAIGAEICDWVSMMADELNE